MDRAVREKVKAGMAHHPKHASAPLAPTADAIGWKGYTWPTVPGLDWTLWSVNRFCAPMFDDNHMTVKGFWLLDLCQTPGRVRIKSSDQWFERKPGDLMLIAPQIAFFEDRRHDGEAPAKRAWFEFSGNRADMLDRLVRNRFDMALIRDGSGRMGQRMLDVIDYAHLHRAEAFWAIQSMGAPVLDALTTAIPVEGPFFRMPDKVLLAPPDPLATRAFDIISQSLTESLTTREIARRLGCSASTLTHHFTRCFGEPLMGALRRLRLFRARTLIAQGYKLAEVAQQTGFWDERHLAKLFSKTMGTTPGRYRRSQQVDSESSGR